MPQTALTAKDELKSIKTLLTSGAFDGFNGRSESAWLECKKQPPLIDAGDAKRLELAKDVAALANSEGGVIVFGCGTEVDQDQRGEQIVSLHPFEQRLLDKQQCDQALGALLYPPVRCEISWFPSAADPSRGLAAIFVPAAPESARPVLVHGAVVDGRTRGNVVGIYERRGAAVARLSIEQLHSLIRQGLIYDGEIRARFDAIDEVLSSLDSRQEATALRNWADSALQTVGPRVRQAIAAARLLDNAPAFALWSAPRVPLTLVGLRSSSSEATKLLENPPKIRNNGFGPQISASGSSLVSANVRRAMALDYGGLELHRDGLLIFVDSATQEGLCWGRTERQRFDRVNLVNPVYLIESILVFSKLATSLYAGLLPSSAPIRLGLGLYGLERSEQPWELETQVAHSARLEPSVRESQLPGVDGTVGDPPSVLAFGLVEEFYAAFKVDADLVPFQDPKGEVSAERLTQARG
jgi:hypothetical protein